MDDIDLFLFAIEFVNVNVKKVEGSTDTTFQTIEIRWELEGPVILLLLPFLSDKHNIWTSQFFMTVIMY